MPKDGQETPPNHEIVAAKDVIVAFLTSMKNYDLYPPEHVLSQKFINNIQNHLANFLSRYGELQISIDLKRLLYKAVPIYEAEASEDNLALLLYRDGLIWIKFLPGLTLEEIKTFLSILNKYRVLQDEPEDDIVTSLWDANLAHIHYEAKELFFEDVPLLDFSMLNKSPAKESPESETETFSGPAPDENDNISEMFSDAGHQHLWILSPEERETLREMVAEAEKSVRKGDVLQALFFVLTKQSNAEDFSAVLDFLKDEWRAEIEIADFARVAQHLTALKRLKESPPPGGEWVVELLAAFFEDISDEKILSSLKPALALLKARNLDQLAGFRSFCLQLEPQAIISLGKLIPHIKAREVLDVLLNVMVKLGSRGIAPLGKLLANTNEQIALRATQVLGEVSGEEAAKLIPLALHHSSGKVRRLGLRLYLATGSPRLDEVFKFIDDPDETTRAVLLAFWGRERNEKAENLMLCHLQNNSTQQLPDEHVQACYRALGLCGSKRSLAFLKKIILGREWKSLLNPGKTVQQRGAIMALSELQIEEATDILKQGAASFLPDIRNSCRSALAKKSRGDGS